MKPEEEDVPVIDLTEDDEAEEFTPSSTKDREAVLAEALAHAATLEAQYSQPLPETKRVGMWKAPLAIVLFGLSAVLLAFPPPWLAGDPPPTLTPAAQERGVHAALYLQAQQVEAFRVKEGRLPGSLEELQGAIPDIEFVRSNNRVFQLVTPGPSGGSVIYDSTRPAPAFLEAVGSWGGKR